MKRPDKINNIVIISDPHCGCQLGLCPPGPIKRDEKGSYYPSSFQKKVWKAWEEWWDYWVPLYTKEEPYILVVNGDVLDGNPYGAKTPISLNVAIQSRIAKKILRPILEKKKCIEYYHIRGTEAHVGKSAENEEALAETLGAIPEEEGGPYSRWEMWTRLDKALIHFSHHIGTTSSSAYESTAVYRELIEAFNEAGRWKDEPPDVVVRSHRHRQFEVTIATDKGMGKSIVTPGWQLKTPLTYRMASGRASTPQVGGYVLRTGDEDEIYSRFHVWKLGRSKEVIL